MEGNYHGQRWTMWFLWKEGIKPSHICNLWRKSIAKAPACSTVFSWVWSFNHGKETAHAAMSGIPRDFFSGGDSTNSVEDSGQRKCGCGGVSPLVKGSTQFANE
jgi:hypothetical protein